MGIKRKRRLLLFNINLIKIETKLKKFILTIRDNTKNDVKIENDKIRDIIFINNLLTIIKIIK